MATEPQVVLVHGAWHGAWCWQPLCERLERRGIKPHTPQLQSSGDSSSGLSDLYADADAVRRLTDSIDGPVILCGHSYGGSVVTQASAGSVNIERLVMIATTMLDVGEPIIGPSIPVAPWLKISADNGALELETLSAGGMFYGCCDEPSAAWATSMLRRYMSFPALTQPITRCGWKERPSIYVLCTQDRVALPERQKKTSINATEVVELHSDHSPFLCMPDKLADIFAAYHSRRV